jgi:hypothetical protein
MNNRLNELWYQICQLSIVEPDSEQFLRLVAEANLLLDIRNAEVNTLRLGEIMSEPFEQLKQLAALCLYEQYPSKLTALAHAMNLALQTNKTPYSDPRVERANTPLLDRQ